MPGIFKRFGKAQCNVTRCAKRLLPVIFVFISGCSNLSNFLFYPHQGHYQTPEKLGIEYATVILNSEGYALENWLIQSSDKPSKATILYLHGNGENMSTHINSVAWLTKHQLDVFLLDYRGYGLSGGESTLQSALNDINQAHLWLSQHSAKPIIILGQSMGGSLAIAYSGLIKQHEQKNRREFIALASESAPASWPQVAREAMSKHWLTWLLQAPASLIEEDYDAEQHIAAIDYMPVLLMHSKEDEIVEFAHFEQLVAAIQKKQVTTLNSHVTKGGHTQGFARKETREHFLDFINKALSDHRE